MSKTTVKVTKPGEKTVPGHNRPFPALNGYKFWIQVVDDFTRHVCEYNKTKNGMGVFIRQLIVVACPWDTDTKYLRCDNAKEHLKAFRRVCNGNFLN
jgi:hypothetical protein